MNRPSQPLPFPASPGLLSGALSAPGAAEPAKAAGVDWRLRKHADYQRVYKATRKQFSQSMSWFAAAREGEPGQTGVTAIRGQQRPLCEAGARVGLTAGKVLGKAHERNRIKRRLREVVRRHIAVLPVDADLILHPRRMVMEMDFLKLDAEVLRIFRQAAQARDKKPAPKMPRPTNA